MKYHMSIREVFLQPINSLKKIIYTDDILVSQGYCNEVSKTVWCERINTYWLTALEISCLKSPCQLGWFLLKALRGTLPQTSPHTFGGLLAVSVISLLDTWVLSPPWSSHSIFLVPLHIAFPLCLSIPVSTSPLYKDICFIGLVPTIMILF